MIGSKLPACRLGAVQSKPIYAVTIPPAACSSRASRSVHWCMKPRSCIVRMKSDFIFAMSNKSNLFELVIFVNKHGFKILPAIVQPE